MYVLLVCVHNQPNKAYEIQQGKVILLVEIEKRGVW